MKSIIILNFLFSVSLFSQEKVNNFDNVLKSRSVMRQNFRLVGDIVVKEFIKNKFKVTHVESLFNLKGKYYTAFSSYRNDIDAKHAAAYVLENDKELEITEYSGGSRNPYTICGYRYTSVNLSPLLLESFEDVSGNLEKLLSENNYAELQSRFTKVLKSYSLKKMKYGHSIDTREVYDGKAELVLLNLPRKEVTLKVSMSPKRKLGFGCGWKVIK